MVVFKNGFCRSTKALSTTLPNRRCSPQTRDDARDEPNEQGVPNRSVRDVRFARARRQTTRLKNVLRRRG